MGAQKEKGAEAPYPYFLLGSGEVSEETRGFLVLRLQTILGEDMLFHAIARLCKIFSFKLTQVADAPVIEIKEPAVTRPLEAVGNNFHGSEIRSFVFR